jgi:anthranilate synthase component 1
MFYLDCGELQIVGASPETLCKVESNKVFNHAIAGTVKRGETAEGLRSLSPHCTYALKFCSQRTNGWVKSY